jgi:hypothetical protein
MNHNSYLAKLQQEAEQSYSNYSGGASGGKKDEYVGMNGRLSNLSGAALATPKTITFDIANSDDKPLAAMLFGAYLGYAQPFNGVLDPITGNTAAAGKGITVNAKNYDLQELLDKSKIEPFTVLGYRYVFGDEAQLKLDWTMKRKEGTSTTLDIHSPAETRNLANNIATAMDNPDFFIVFDAKQALYIQVAPAISASVPRTIQLILKVNSEVDVVSALKGESVVKVNNGY